MAYSFGVVGYDAYDIFLLGEKGKTAYRSFFRVLLETDGAVF